MDVDTGFILTQQMLTHENHIDVLPMFEQYVQRCSELSKPLPTRICSDRGLMDSNLIHSSSAFPASHINVDPWHFIQNFVKSLNKSSTVVNDVKSAFSVALYNDNGIDADGRSMNVHAEPEEIIARVDELIKKYSTGGVTAACITEQTKSWWKDQLVPIREARILSNPSSSSLTTTPTISSSSLENYHRHLNKLTRSIKMNERRVHSFVMQMTFQWNVDRSRAVGREQDWHTYDWELLLSAFESTVRLVGTVAATAEWSGGFHSPQRLVTIEQFGLVHRNVTLGQQLNAVSVRSPFSDALLTAILQQHAFQFPDKAIKSSIRSFLAIDADANSQSSSPSMSIESTTEDADVSSSASSDSMSTVVAILPWFDQTVLYSMILKDPIIRDAVEHCEWKVAAGRWNEFVKCTNNPARAAKCGSCLKHSLHSITAPSMEKCVKAINKRREKNIEKDIIESKNVSRIPYNTVDLKTRPFTAYEEATLMRLTSKSTPESLAASQSTNSTSKGARGKKQIVWTQVFADWYYQYQAEVEADEADAISARTQTTLKIKFEAMKRSLKKRKLEEAKSASNSDNSDESDNGGSEGESEPTPQSVALTPAVHMVTTPIHTNSRRWQAEESALIEKLLHERNGSMSYREFAEEWTKTSFEYVSESRYNNKLGSFRKTISKKANSSATGSKKARVQSK